MKTLLFLLLMSGTAFCYTNGGSYPDGQSKGLKPVGSQYSANKEAFARVERYDVALLQNDPEVLVSVPAKKTPKFEVSEPVAISKEDVQREYLPQANPMADVKVSATIESDGEQAVNYPL